MRTLITGASGSGTTTLARALATRLQVPALDVDNYYWLPTSPPFRSEREPQLRLALLLRDLDAVQDSVCSGSIIDWGAELEDSFSLIVFLVVPGVIRIERLQRRETALFGHADPAFLEWAAQ